MTKVVPIQRFEEVTVEYGVGLAKCIMVVPSCKDIPVPKSGLTCTGEIRLMPDLSTKIRVPWCVPCQDVKTTYGFLKEP